MATLKLGLLTSTLDPDGEIILEEEVKPFCNAALIKALEKFSGTIKQTPPQLALSVLMESELISTLMRAKKF